MFPYEKMEVYLKAYKFNGDIYQFLKLNSSIPLHLKTQLGRATLSIMLNIAEGSAKFSNKDRRNFYIIARGSAFECCSIISFLKDENEITEELKNSYYNTLEELSRKLYTMIRNLEQ